MKRENQELTPEDKTLDNLNSDIYDESLPHSLRRSVWLVQDEEDAETYTADEILDGQPQGIIFDIRHSLYASYKSGEYKYVCKQCQQPLGLKIRTYEGDFFPFFSHFQNSGECPLKHQIEIDPTHSAHERETVFKVSVLYQQMIERLKEVLNRTQGFNNIEENRVISKPEIKGYRKPAVYSRFNNIEVCFDLLVSNPLVSLLVGRNAFYKLHKMFYLWLFPSFTTKQQRLCQKDILYMNRRNVFVFDSKEFYNPANRSFCGPNTNPLSHLYAYEESIRMNKLMLNCYWQTPEVTNVNGKSHISIKWNGPKLVAFEDLKLDWDNFELYYHDSDVDFYKKYPIEIQRQIDEWLRIKKDRWVKIFDSIEKRKILYAQLLAKRERRERLNYYLSLVEGDEADVDVRYDDKSKLYGFTVDDFDIIPPSYYDAKPFFCGYAWVRKKERWGVIDIYNNRVTKFQYSQLYELGNGLFTAYKNQKNVLIDYKGEQKGNSTFDSIERLNARLYKIGNIIVTGYDRGYISGSGFFNYKKTKTLWGIINDNGEEILPCVFDSIGDYEDGKAKVTHDQHTGYIDENGHEEYELNVKDDIIIYKSPLLSKLGLMDNNENILIPPTYDYIGDFCDGLAIVKIGKNSWSDKHGIIDKSGNLITDSVDYSNVKIFYHGIYATYKDGQYTIKKARDASFAKEFKEIGKFDEEFIIVSKENLWGIINYEGEVVIPIKYGEIVNFNRNNVLVKRHRLDNHVVEIDWKGNEIYPIHHIENAWIYESKLNMKFGLMDEAHHPLTELEYSEIEHLHGDHFKALKDGKWGIINSRGDTILSFDYSSIYHISEGYFKIAKGQIWDQKWGVLDPKGEIIIPIDFYQIYEFNNGVISVKKDKYSEVAQLNLQGEEIYTYRNCKDVIIYESILLSKSGIMDNKGTPITGLTFDFIKDFHDGKAKAKIGSFWGVIDASGEIIIPFKFYEIGDFVDGIASAKIRGEGFIDDKGNEIYIYHDLGDLSICESRLLKRFGIMPIGQTQTPELIYGCMPKFKNDRAIVLKGNQWGIINKNEDIVVPFNYDEIVETRSNNYIVKKNRKYGILNSTGHILVPLKYARIIEKEVGLYCVREEQNSYWGLINDSNICVIPIKYDAVGDVEKDYVNVKKGRWWKKIAIHNTVKTTQDKSTIDLSKLEEGIVYDAISTGVMKHGVFIKIPEIGIGLIPAKDILSRNRKLNEFKKGVSIKVMLLKKEIEKNRATFKLTEY